MIQQTDTECLHKEQESKEETHAILKPNKDTYTIQKKNKITIGEAFTKVNEVDEAKNKLHLTILWSLRPLYIMMIFFIFILFFAILPASELSYNNDDPSFFQEWSRAFMRTTNTLLIGLSALIVSAIIKEIFEFIRKLAKK